MPAGGGGPSTSNEPRGPGLTSLRLLIHAGTEASERAANDVAASVAEHGEKVKTARRSSRRSSSAVKQTERHASGAPPSDRQTRGAPHGGGAPDIGAAAGGGPRGRVAPAPLQLETGSRAEAPE